MVEQALAPYEALLLMRQRELGREERTSIVCSVSYGAEPPGVSQTMFAGKTQCRITRGG
jgi:hypothetical protein